MKAQAFERLQEELNKAQEVRSNLALITEPKNYTIWVFVNDSVTTYYFLLKELKLKDEQCEKLSRVRNELEAELEDLTASLFQVCFKLFYIQMLETSKQIGVVVLLNTGLLIGCDIKMQIVRNSQGR